MENPYYTRASQRYKTFWRIEKSVGTISQKVLTTNLRLMEEDGLIERKVYAQVPPKVEYTLTDIGYSLAVVLDAMAEWGSGYRQFLKILENKSERIKNMEKLSHSQEDYLEEIYNQVLKSGCAKVTDISNALNVRKASVTGALNSLAAKKLINYEPYSKITLTQEGENLAREIVNKHNGLCDFS